MAFDDFEHSNMFGQLKASFKQLKERGKLEEKLKETPNPLNKKSFFSAQEALNALKEKFSTTNEEVQAIEREFTSTQAQWNMRGEQCRNRKAQMGVLDDKIGEMTGKIHESRQEMNFAQAFTQKFGTDTLLAPQLFEEADTAFCQNTAQARLLRSQRDQLEREIYAAQIEHDRQMLSLAERARMLELEPSKKEVKK